jgi:hypothetical protein
MKKEKLKELSLQEISSYRNACNNIVNLFVKKQGYEFDGWAGKETGGIADFIGQYFFSMSDMIFDLENNAEKGKIIEWQDYCTEFHSNVNYDHFLMGAPKRELKGYYDKDEIIEIVAKISEVNSDVAMKLILKVTEE